MPATLPTDTIGANIRTAREAMKWSQNDLGISLRVSVQAISQWETGKTLPSLDNIMAAASLLNVHPGFLLWGEEFGTLSDARHGDGSRIPIIWWDAVPALRDHDDLAGAAKGKISGYLTPTTTHIPTEFALEIESKSMEPDFTQGDHVLIERHMGAGPGSIVLAVVYDDEKRPIPMLRKLQIRSEGKRRTVFRLVPLNPDFPTIELANAKDGYIVGTVVEQRHYYRSVKGLYGFDLDEWEYEEAVRRDAQSSSNT